MQWRVHHLFDGDELGLGFQWPGAPGCCAADNMKPHGTETLSGRIYGWDGPGGEKDGTDTSGQGNDRIDGGDGVETLYGDAGHDALCDTPENTGAQIFDGGSGNDTLWLAPGWGQGFDSSSSGGNGTDKWGDSASWTQPYLTEIPISSEPPTGPP